MASPTSSSATTPDPAPDANLTREGIANLYSQLQSVVDHDPDSPSHGQSAAAAAADNLDGSPSETPKAPVSAEAADDKDDCPCQHLLPKNTDTSERCQLCNRVIPFVATLHQTQSALKDAKRQIADLQQQHAILTRAVHEKAELVFSLKHDVATLNEKYVSEIEKVAEIQHAKSLVETELEELSQQLFEEANGMVATEKKEKYHLQLQQKRLVDELENTREQLNAQEMQLQALKKIIEEQQDDQRLGIRSKVDEHIGKHEHEEEEEEDEEDEDHHGYSHRRRQLGERPDPDRTAAHDLIDLFCNQLRLSVKAAAKRPDHLITGTDEILMKEFTLFVRQSMIVSLKKVNSLPFMKPCLEEDILPSLRFGPNSRLSSRKLVDAIMLNTCFIEETPPGFAEAQAKSIRESETPLRISSMKLNLWERFSSTTGEVGPFVGCQACGRPPNDPSAPLAYRVRTTYFDDWACIDRFCRDRLVAVCEFYMFVRNVHEGYYTGRSIPGLYHEAMRLRLQMFYARLGVLPWILRSLGLKEDSYGEAPELCIRTPSPLPKNRKE